RAWEVEGLVLGLALKALCIMFRRPKEDFGDIESLGGASQSQLCDGSFGESSLSYNSKAAKVEAFHHSKPWVWGYVSFLQMMVITYMLFFSSPRKCAALLKQGQGDDSEPSLVGFVEKEEAHQLERLIVVTGHATTMSSGCHHDLTSDKGWYLLSYQRDKDIPASLLDHIKHGVELAHSDPKALLVFTGNVSHTRRFVQKSEASAYYFAALESGWWGTPEVMISPVQARACGEDFSRDSFENVLFSVARFREVTGHYPTHLTVVGYDFKEWRFKNLHMPALGWPLKRFTYAGLVPQGAKFDHEGARRGEEENSVVPFSHDPYGCIDPKLVRKKAERCLIQPCFTFDRAHAYRESAPELRELLDWCSEELYAGSLPWQ
ncbi:unnamed protein product, partial [Chrysoparadoxa australica]